MLNNSSIALWVVGHGHTHEHRSGLLLYHLDSGSESINSAIWQWLQSVIENLVSGVNLVLEAFPQKCDHCHFYLFFVKLQECRLKFLLFLPQELILLKLKVKILSTTKLYKMYLSIFNSVYQLTSDVQ